MRINFTVQIVGERIDRLNKVLEGTGTLASAPNMRIKLHVLNNEIIDDPGFKADVLLVDLPDTLNKYGQAMLAGVDPRSFCTESGLLTPTVSAFAQSMLKALDYGDTVFISDKDPE